MPADRKRMQVVKLRVTNLDPGRDFTPFDIELLAPALLDGAGKVEVVSVSKPMPMPKDLMFDDFREVFD